MQNLRDAFHQSPQIPHFTMTTYNIIKLLIMYVSPIPTQNWYALNVQRVGNIIIIRLKLVKRAITSL